MNRYCGPRASKNKYADVFSRAQVVEMARKVLPLKQIRGMTKLELCKILNLPLEKPVPVVDHSKNCIERSQKKLHDYQERVVRFMMKNRALVVFHKVGSGKTLTAITVSQCYLDKFPDNKVIVVAPAGLIDNFKKEMTHSYKNVVHKDKYHFYSYQKLMNLGKSGETMLCVNSLLIIDEAHNLRNIYRENTKGRKSGIMNRYATLCAKSAHKVLLLTATPLYNSINDIKSIHHMIEGDREYNLDNLRCKISYRGDNPVGFPKRRDVNEYIVMSRQFEEKYIQAIEKIMNQQQSQFLDKLYGTGNKQVFYNVIRRTVNNLEDTNSAKIQWIIQKLRQDDRKSVVFSHFLDAGIKCVMKAIKDKKYKSISGEVPMTERKKIVQEFNSDEFPLLFISKAGGEGLDLKGVRDIIIMEPSWNEATEEQVIGRGIRFKSHEHLPEEERIVDIYHLYHVRPSDMDHITTRPEVMSPYTMSIDLFMFYLKKEKQKEINSFIQKIKKLSIEKNDDC